MLEHGPVSSLGRDSAHSLSLPLKFPENYFQIKDVPKQVFSEANRPCSLAFNLLLTRRRDPTNAGSYVVFLVRI